MIQHTGNTRIIYTLDDAERVFVDWLAAKQDSVIPQLKHDAARIEAQILAIEQAISRAFNPSWLRRTWRRRRGMERIARKQIELVQLKARRTAIVQDINVRGVDGLARAMFRRALDIPRVTAISVELPMIWHIYTDTLFCYDPRRFDSRYKTGQWYRLGKFKISVNLTNKDPRHIEWARCSGLPRGVPSLILTSTVAPQVPQRSQNCLGTAAMPIQQLIEGHKYDELVAVLVRYLECYQDASKLQGWPRVPDTDVPEWYRTTVLKW